jgi:hypothetical protein
VDLLGELAPRIAELDPELRGLDDQVADLRRNLQQAVTA